jgi:hypothetical protein
MKSKSKKYGGIGQILPQGVLQQIEQHIPLLEDNLRTTLEDYTLLTNSHKGKIRNIFVTYYRISRISEELHFINPDEEIISVYEHLHQMHHDDENPEIEDLQFMVNTLRMMINTYFGAYNKSDTAIIDQLNHIINPHKTKSRKYVKSGSHSKNAKKSKSSTRRRHSAPI